MKFDDLLALCNKDQYIIVNHGTAKTIKAFQKDSNYTIFKDRKVKSISTCHFITRDNIEHLCLYFIIR